MSDPPEESEAKRSKQEPVADTVTCAVCLVDVTDLSRTQPCGHRFDKACIESSLARDNRCPTCRDVIGELEFNFKPGEGNERKEISHPSEQVATITPDISIRFCRAESSLIAKVTVAKDAILVLKTSGTEETFEVKKDKPFFVPIPPAEAEEIGTLIRIDGDEDRELVLPPEESEDEDEDEAVVVPTEEEVRASQGIIRILDFLRDRMGSMDHLNTEAAAGGEDTDEESNDEEAASGAETSNPVSEPVTQTVPQTETVVVAVPVIVSPPPVSPVIPPTEEIAILISPSVCLSYKYPKATLAHFTAAKMLILKIKEGEEETSFIIRPEESVFLLEAALMTMDVIVKEDGKEYPLSLPFKERIQSMDQASGYVREVPEEDDDDDDSSDDETAENAHLSDV